MSERREFARTLNRTCDPCITDPRITYASRSHGSREPLCEEFAVPMECPQCAAPPVECNS